VQQALAGRPAEALLELPVMSEPRALALAQIFTTLVPAAFQTNQQLFGLVLLKAVSLSLAAGNPPAAPHFYASYALLYAIITGDLATAYRFGRLAVALGERPPHRGSAGSGELVFASFVAHWQSHISESLAHYQRGLRASLEVGDHLSFGYCVSHGCFTRLFAGSDLASVHEEAQGFTAPLRNASDHINSSLVRTVIRALETLRGGAWNDTSLDRGGLPEQADLEAMQVNPTLLGMHLIVKTMALYFAGDLAGAQAASDGAEAICAYQRGMLWSVEHPFYRALVHAALLRSQPPEQRETLAAALEQDEQALRALAAAVPVNHGHKLALVAAERAALRGDGGQALAHFDRALALAAEHGFAHHEALINERYALFHLDQGRPRVARLYLLEAHHGYTRWGAIVKAHALAAAHQELFHPSRQPSLRPGAPASLHSTSSMGGLDLATAVRVTQTITSELMLDKLIEQLMRSLVESAGAQRGFLIVPEEQHLRLSATVTVEPDQVRLHLDQDLDTSTDLATAVVHYVARTHEPVVLADARADRRFGRDRYIDQMRPKSILAVAMVHHGRLRGVLYLENNAARAAFDPTRTELLQFLAAQAATAIENATLYEELEQRVAERTAALASANEQLQTSLKELGDAQRSLIDMSRQAGMADVATSILHNVGNVLNSVNVSASVVISAVEHSKAAGIGKLAKLLEEQRPDLGRFLTEDARGTRIPMYLTQLSQAVELEQSAVKHELGVLRKNLDHINAVVAMQQTHAKGGGLAEEISPRELLEDAIKLGTGALGPEDGELISVCDELPTLLADRHKILQIVMNLLSNARDAVRGAADRRIILRCRKLDDRLALSVEDRGVGILEEHLTRVFNFGFTTKKDGHGFGLHASALAAAELGGSLVCRSDGPGKGATFTLEVPYRLPSASRRASLAS
jgi:signal transduction histidine kinase